MRPHVLAWVIALSAASVAAAEPCPSPEQLRQRLRELGAPVESLREVSVVQTGHGAELSATRDDGSTLDRPLGDGDCPALTDAAGVILLAWLIGFEGPPPPATVVTPAPPPAPPPAEPEQPLAFTAGAGVSLWWGDSATWGGEGYVALAPHAWRVQPELIVLGQGERKIALITGYGYWSRASLATGLSALFGSSGLQLRVELGLVTGAVFIGGRGFVQNQSETSWDLGGRAGVRLGYGGWPVRPYLSLGVIAWAVGHRLDLRPEGAAATLPYVDLQVSVGVELGR